MKQMVIFKPSAVLQDAEFIRYYRSPKSRKMKYTHVEVMWTPLNFPLGLDSRSKRYCKARVHLRHVERIEWVTQKPSWFSRFILLIKSIFTHG